MGSLEEDFGAIDKQFLAAPIKESCGQIPLVPEFLKVRGLVKQHLDSYNYFVNIGIKKIVRANALIESGIDPQIGFRYTNVEIGEPCIDIDTARKSLVPQECRLWDMTYAAPIIVSVVSNRRINGRIEPPTERKNIVIGRMPVMLRSCRCVLNGKDEDELARLGECPLDPGGYFVVKGTEKVVLIQEQLSNNQLLLILSTEKIKSKTVILMDKDRIYLLLNQFSKKVPIMSDQEVVQMVGRDPRYANMLLPSIQECATANVYSQKQALEYLDNNVKKYGFSNASQEGRALSILRDVFIANVPVREMNFRRMMDANLNKAAIDDKDYVGNKRLELSGQLISLLLRICTSRSPESYIMGNSITQGLERALSTGNWDLKRFRMHKTGMSQVLARLSFIAAVGQMTRVKPQFEKSRKVSGPRALQPSQWGMLCPCDTPEGEACGLIKNLALMTHVTTDQEEGPIISLCHSLGVESLEQLSAEEIHAPNSFLVIFNGIILGKHRLPQRFATCMRKFRRAGKIGEFISVYVNEKQQCVYIASDGGRVCRPLVIADKGISRIKEHHMQELRDGVRTFSDFVYNNVLIGLYEGEPKEEITHLEIEPLTILGVCAGLIPYPHHNQSPRNTYQCAMGKQAMGNIAYNQLSRMDSLLYLLLGAGQNATVAVMSYSGYDIEDAIVMNKSSLDRGFGGIRNNTQDRILAPEKDDLGKLKDEKMRILDKDGIAIPGQIIRPRDIYVNKEVPKDTTGTVNPLKFGFNPAHQRHKGNTGETEVIDRVALFSDINNNLCMKFQIRHTRRPEIGDKFSSRHGQKGVCGTIVQQEDFPFSERGICPDLIMNPHGFPSRMTIGKMIELLGGKAGVSCGRFHYGNTVEAISKTLVEKGFSYNGKDFLYSGITGSPLQAYIFMGPIYYQKLKHMVLDKMHARGSGPKVMLTRQPTEGKARNGGLRVGEMERDCLIAYGASMLIYERLMISSDPFEVQVCRACGLLGYYNRKLKIGVCSSCKNSVNMSKMKLPYACKLLFQELQSMNIVPRLKLTEAT
ncbi:hypothetical protein MKW92_015065 [Papaver armeniacum]|nr:hypothetical protein MKW92_015065 [Papaver armeniacum]